MARVALGPKNVLDQMSKLVKISQKVAAAGMSQLKERLRFVVEMLYLRLARGQAPTSLVDLQNKELPKLIKVHSLLSHVLVKFTYEDDIVKRLFGYVMTPLKWHETLMAQGRGSQPAIVSMLVMWPNRGSSIGRSTNLGVGWGDDSGGCWDVEHFVVFARALVLPRAPPTSVLGWGYEARRPRSAVGR